MAVLFLATDDVARALVDVLFHRPRKGVVGEHVEAVLGDPLEDFEEQLVELATVSQLGGDEARSPHHQAGDVAQ